MKKTLLFIVAILMSVSVFAQTRTTFISEHFDGSAMPEGWQVMENGASCWSISATQNAGGIANELKLYYSPQFNGTSRMVMPAVDLTGVSSVVVSFKHCLDNYQGSHTLGVATTSDDGATWNVAWSQSYSSDGQWNINQVVSTPDMGNSNVRFCIYYTGNSYNIDNWYFDDIEIFTQENLDLQLASIDVNSVLGAGVNDIKCTVINKGVENVNEITMSYQLDNEPTVVETFTVNLSTFASTELTFSQPVTFIPGSYNLTLNIEAVNGVNDDDPNNNTLEKTIGVALGSTQRIPMIEHFSSSTCGPCVSVNTQMLNFTNTHPGMFTYTKYQMNWPGNGDPYYTAEGGTRRTYYGVSAVPQCFLDGEDQGYAAVQTTVFDQHYANPAFADVRGSFNVSGNIITVKVDFMSYYDLNTAKAFVSVNEKETHNNVGGNGETSFHHIFMKFLTEATGNPVNIEAGNYQHFEFTQDMSGTHVEEMTDLEVSAWLQEYGTKEMLNSHFLYEYTDIHPYPVQNLAVNVNNGTLVAGWAAPEGGNALSYNVYINGEIAGNVTATEFTTSVAEEFNVVAVEALYQDDMTSVKIVKSTASAPVPQTEPTISVNEITFEDCEPVTFTITNETAAPFTINEISQDVTFMEYLGIETSAGLPATLAVGESLEVTVGINVYVKGYVETTIAVVSDIATQTIPVFINEEIISGIDENSNSYEIYPNPTNGNIVVKGNNINEVEVYNLCGQKVLTVNGKQNVNVDMSSLTSGVYMVKVVDGNGNATVNKVVKE